MAAVLRHDSEDVVDGECGAARRPSRGGEEGVGTPLCVVTSGKTEAHRMTGYFCVFYLGR